MPKNILLIDNNDSFTYNLVELLRQLKVNFSVINIHDFIPNLKPSQITDFSHIIISPGPDVPRAYPKIYAMLQSYIENPNFQHKPILGVCLGHQIICDFFGAKVYNLPSPRHGMVGRLAVNPDVQSKMFANLPSAFNIGLYHSWAVRLENFPQELQIMGRCQDEIVMAIEHKNLPIFGVQFHPESYISEFGLEILANFLAV